MEDDKKRRAEAEKTDAKTEKPENWPEEAVQDILDYIEEQGIYIRE